MADQETKSRDDVVSPVNDSDLESQDDKEEVFLLESDSEDDSDSERKPVDSVQVEKIERKMPGINPRIDQSLSDIVKKQKHVKRYENKNSAKFVTGLDITSKEARKKREDRAKRFGASSKDKSGEKEEEEEQEDISNVVLAPGSKIDGSPVRFEALHLIGVDDMSTQDIFSYFQSYDPSSIEWINDTSCNIVWMDPHSAARALLGMSKPREGYFKLGLKNLAQSRHLLEPEPVQEPEPRIELESEPMEEGGDEDEDGVDLVSDRETGEKVRPPAARIIPTSTTNSHSNYAGRRDEGMEGIQLGDEDLGPVDITHEEALRRGRDEILMRYATRDDVKESGAYKHSQYYIKYGNPNFGGMRGIITQSMKQKIRQGKYIPGQARKRRYEDDSDGERELEEEWPRKRRVPGRLERRLGERETGRQHRSPLQPPHSEDEAGRSSGDDDEEEEEEEEGANLEAEVRHALRDGNEGRHKVSRRMYADEIDDEIKKIRDTVEVQQATEQVMTDARERLRQTQGQGQERLSVKSRLGALVGHSITPAPSMENLKVILDVNDRLSDAWQSSGDEGGESYHEEVDYESDELDLGSDLRSRLSRRQPETSQFRPGFRDSDTTPAFLENLPSLQIEIREEL
ncbi:nuclear cap-binding protein subunit 3-like isoform X1 [Strongylocentrotus purpuratus]|uniref:Nuclear cap-binding protein subunit 3 n=1 Tax=Strongylocentrotus purpuratus TaxID=7668 RepID=A0A7M7PAP0_STRPU|nr:nuclear cap-binding protein subunit 3-like isoform X1 [Strongylocentrotus purpuratus]